MANKILDPTNPSPSAPYETPATAATSLASLLAGTTLAAGEVIFCLPTCVDNAYAANTTLSSPAAATIKQPQQLICVTDLNDPTTPSSGAIIGTTGNYSLSLQGKWRIQGVDFSCGNGASGYVRFGNSPADSIYLEDFDVKPTYTGTSAFSFWLLGENSSGWGGGSPQIYKTARIKTNHSLNRINIQGSGLTVIDGLTVDPGSVTSCTGLFLPNAKAIQVVVRNFDVSHFSTALGLFTPGSCTGSLKFVNGKISAVATALASAITVTGFRLYLINVDDGSDNKRYEIYDYAGVIYLDSGVYAASTPSLFRHDNAPVSLRLVTNANASYFCPLVTEWVEKSGESGVAVTIDIEALVGADGAAALDTRELWLDVEYLGSSASPLGTSVTTQASIIAAAGTAVAAGTTAWTGDGYTTERTHKLTATFTPQMDGYYRYRVALAKASTTVYLNMV